MHSESYLMADNMKSLQEILAKRTNFYGEYPQHNILKFFGHCNDIDREMRKCLKKEDELIVVLQVQENGRLEELKSMSQLMGTSSEEYQLLCKFAVVTST
ncbi:Cmc2 [Columba livia]|nr:Cmc2 [Columba livia]